MNSATNFDESQLYKTFIFDLHPYLILDFFLPVYIKQQHDLHRLQVSEFLLLFKSINQ